MAEMPTVECVCITGPTACGKTELALELAEHLPLEVISMDSAMVYRGLDIGTAKPSVATRDVVPHHLIDIVEPTDAYSAGRFARDAADAIAQIRARSRLPLLVGGTLLLDPAEERRVAQTGAPAAEHVGDHLRRRRPFSPLPRPAPAE